MRRRILIGVVILVLVGIVVAVLVRAQHAQPSLYLRACVRDIMM